MTVTININCDDRAELSRLLTVAAKRVELFGPSDWPLIDTNKKHVGQMTVKG